MAPANEDSGQAACRAGLHFACFALAIGLVRPQAALFASASVCGSIAFTAIIGSTRRTKLSLACSGWCNAREH